MAVSSTNSTSSWSSMFGIKNNGIGGLATGLDTESLVKALTSGTQLKITKQQQQRQLLSWRQENYRSVITALQAFQKKSFQNTGTTASTTNILHSNFFSTYKSTSSSDKVSVSAGSNATLGEIKIQEITQVATAQTFKSKDLGDLDVSFAKDLLTKDYGSKTAFTGQTIKITFNDSTKLVKLDDLNNALVLDSNGKYTLNKTDFEDTMQSLLKTNFAQTSTTTNGTTTKTNNIQLVEDSNGVYKLTSDTGRFTTNSSNALLGLENDKSNHMSTTTTTLQAMEGFFGTEFQLQGDTLSFSINDTLFTVNRTDTLKSIMDKINSSTANVRMEYSGTTGRFTLTSKVTGGADNIVMKDVSGNLMNQLFGVQGGGSLKSASTIMEGDFTGQGVNAYRNINSDQNLTAAEKAAKLKDLANNMKYKGFDMTINGVTKYVKLDSGSIDPSKYTEQEFLNAINTNIKYYFGSDSVKLEIDSNGKTKVTAPAGTSVSFGESASYIGFTKGDTNLISDANYNGKISVGAIDLSVNGNGDFDLPANGTIKVKVGSKEIDVAINFDGLRKVKAGTTAAAQALKTFNETIQNTLDREFGAGAVKLELGNPYEYVYEQMTVKGKDGNTYEVYQKQAFVEDGGKKYYEFNDNGTTVYGDENGKFYKKNGTSYDEITGADKTALNDKLLRGTLKRVSTNENVYVRTENGTQYTYADTAGSASTGTWGGFLSAGYVRAQQAQQNTIKIGNTDHKLYVDDKGVEYYEKLDQNDNKTYLHYVNATGTAQAGDRAPTGLSVEAVYNYELKGSGTAFTLTTSNQHNISISSNDANFFKSIGFDPNAANTTYTQNADNTFGSLASGQSLEGTLKFNGIIDSATGQEAEIAYNSSMSIRAFMDAVKAKTSGQVIASFENGSFSLSGANGTLDITDNVVTGKNGLLKSMFNLKNNEYQTADKDQTLIDANMTMGQNMQIVINGDSQSFANNSVTIDGVTISVKGTSSEEITINTVSDATETMDRIRAWVDDYNALVHTLNQAVTETRPKSNGSLYDPLTDDQKAEMSESEITKWETEAKKGLLYNDSAIKNVLSEMRQALYERVEAAGLSLWDLGLQTVNSLDSLEHGKLEFVPASYSSSGLNGEDRLKKLLETEPDKVRAFFQGADGLGNKINDIMTKAVSTSSVNRGTLVKIAGTTTNTGDNTSTLGNKMDEIDKYISNLKLRLESEYNRYWKNFTALETAVSKMNSQSSWLQSNA